MNSFQELEVWKSCRDLRVIVWKIAKTFPSEEKYRLTDQMIRASRSVTTQIAEGFGRFHFQENIQYCRVSRGSLYELIDHLTVALDSEYIDGKIFNEVYEKIGRCLKLLNGYINYLIKAKEKSSGNQVSESETYYGGVNESEG
jgi:four helix bundle protein